MKSPNSLPCCKCFFVKTPLSTPTKIEYIRLRMWSVFER